MKQSKHQTSRAVGAALQGFYADFARVADDESRHLSWCLQRLEELGYAYGDMVAHSILWEGAHASSGEPAGVLSGIARCNSNTKIESNSTCTA